MRTNLMPMVVALTLTGPAAGAATYTVETIDYPGAASTSLSASKDAGRVIGSYTAPGATVATGFTERNGVYTSIPFTLPCRPSGRCHTGFLALNDWGLTAGAFSADVDYPGAFTQQIGGTPTIVQPPGYPTTAVQIAGLNNLGVLAGYFIDYTDPNATTRIFEAIGSTFRVIPLPVAGAVSSTVAGLNNWGQLVGSYETADGVGHSFVLTGTYMQELHLPAEWGGNNLNATDINDFGVVVGNYLLPPAPDYATGHGFMVSHGVWQKIDFPGALDTYVQTINNRGEVLGSYYTSFTGGAASVHTFLLSNGVYTDLGTVLPPGYSVVGIDNRGRLFGYYPDDPSCQFVCITHGF